MRNRRFIGALAAGLFAIGVAGCGLEQANAQADEPLKIVASTAILADIAGRVAGDLGQVQALVPATADPHTYEPSLRDVRRVARADVVFANHLLLEENALYRAMTANLREGVSVTQVAEEAPRYGARLVNLVEDAKLDTVWLGMRVREAAGADSFKFEAVAADGPGVLAAYLTGTFGQPRPYFNSGDGLDRRDSAELPGNAHTHMSWAFSEPGIYRLRVRAGTVGEKTATSDIIFAVGTDPHQAVTHLKAAGKTATILRKGHIDLTYNAAQNRIELYGDRQDGELGDTVYDPASTIVVVPNTALNEIPARPEYRFLGSPGAPIYVLAQAVLGKHVHGEIDPHVWHSVPNVVAMVKVMRDAMIAARPELAARLNANTNAYIAELEALERYVRQTLETIPTEARNLVTPHDAYAYLGQTYGLNIAGFVTPNPGVEPSGTDMMALSRTLSQLRVPAVFVEPTLAGRVRELTQTAAEHGVRVCPIYGDTLDTEVPTYVSMMATNAYNLAVCLNPGALPPPVFQSPAPTPQSK